MDEAGKGTKQGRGDGAGDLTYEAARGKREYWVGGRGEGDQDC